MKRLIFTYKLDLGCKYAFSKNGLKTGMDTSKPLLWVQVENPPPAIIALPVSTSSVVL